jgi:3-deoxy-D-manno-octulosonic-acid transferase
VARGPIAALPRRTSFEGARGLTLSLSLYRLLTAAAEPALPWLLKGRARKGKEEVARLGERLGRASQARPSGPLAWLHGASVGESLSLLPLIDGLSAARPEMEVLVTSGTVASAQILASRLPSGVIHQYAPVDAPGVARRFLKHWKPDLVVFAESELWPNLIFGAKERGARLALVSARMTQKSADGWKKAGGAARWVLTAFDLVLPQDSESARRFQALGATPDGSLNLKLAGGPLPVDAVALAGLRAAAAGRPVLLAASTHPGEDEIVLEAFAHVRSLRPDALLVIAPRHPTRAVEVLALARAAGFTADRRTETAFGASDVHVADTLGELGLWFALADLSLIAGSLVSEVGGHNPLEPARLGRPFVSGPWVDNWGSVFAALAAENAYVEVTDAKSLASAFLETLAQPFAADARAARAKAFAEAQGANLDAAVDQLSALLPTPSA